MFKNVMSLEKSLVRNSNFLEWGFGGTSVRWRKKPRWLPVAPSKMFRVPQRNVLPREEYEELKKLHHVYKTEMKSIRRFFNLRTARMTTGEDVIAEQKREEHEDNLKAIEINDEWNRNVAKHREEVLAKDKEEEMEKILKTLEENRIKYEEKKKALEQIIREEKERAKTYITAENVDAAIDQALENPVDFNYSIDLNLNIYHGRRERPQKLPPSQPQDEPEQKVVTSG